MYLSQLESTTDRIMLMDSCASSITMNDVSEDIEEPNLPKSPKISQDHWQAHTPAAERDNVFYFETVTFQVRFDLFFCWLFIICNFTGRGYALQRF